MKIGMLGCGNIGSFLLETLNREGQEGAKITAIYSRNYEKTSAIAKQHAARAYASFDSFMEADVDLVVEVATIELVHETAIPILKRQKPIIISSIGAFSDPNFLDLVRETAQGQQTPVYLPSGAVGGLDLLRAANAINGLSSVKLTTRKPASSLRGSEHIQMEKVVFSGSAKEAIALYPRNMNVAIAISLAGLGAERTAVELIADPRIERNKHRIEAEGDFGQFSIDIRNEAMPQNPKTSYLAALSILEAIQGQARQLHIG